MAPIRVKSRPLPGTDTNPASPSTVAFHTDSEPLPDIELGDSFRDVIKKLSIYIANVVTLPSTFEQLRTTSAGDRLRALVTHLSITCDNPCIVNALLALKWHYGASNEDRGLSEARANACEIVAWRFLTHLSEREAVDFCLYEIPGTKTAPGGVSAPATAGRGDEETGTGGDEPDAREPDETAPLLQQIWSTAENTRKSTRRRGPNRRYQLLQSISRLTMTIGGHDSDDGDEEDDDDDPTAPFVYLNALEIAAIADAKRFLSQNVVQKIITGIWNGDIVFWDRLEVDAVKKPRFYNPHTADPFSRLRVPKYLKSFEVMYFLAFLVVFYLTLLDRDPTRVSPVEGLFYVFLAAFAYDELSEWIDAGSLFYVYDFWNVFDLIMICIGATFAVLRTIGLAKGDAYLIELSFDILALEALFMVPRVSSILSLSPYWGTLIPCFKEMTKDFIKFMVLVVIIYLGFLTTFSLIGRDDYTLPHMTMILTKIFFGSSYVGFEIMDDIDPVFGPPLMLVFVTLSSILLMGSLTGMLSNSFSRVMGHAREEYLYVYSIYVLEASTSNRLTHFYPPFNLLALVIFRPLRLVLPSSHKLRAARISLLKVTHLPIVVTIQLYEYIRGQIRYGGEEYSAIHGPRQQTPAVRTVVDSVGHDHTSSSAVDWTLGTPTKSASRLPAGRHPVSSSSRPGSRALSVSNLSHKPTPSRDSPAIPARVTDAISAAAIAAATDTVSLAAEEDTGMDAPSDTDVRIAELSAKIDRLTALVLQMQAAQTESK